MPRLAARPAAAAPAAPKKIRTNPLKLRDSASGKHNSSDTVQRLAKFPANREFFAI
jgi:hypothetical protein